MLLLITYIGSYMADLRRTVRDRNTRLQETNLRWKPALEELHDLATRDHLTRLPNRRSALERLRTETAPEKRLPRDSAVCVGLLDIDHFKRVNDTCGHQVGDLALCAVADTLQEQETVWPDDFVGRYGGEEFLLIFSAPLTEAARQAAERARQAASTLQIEGLTEGYHVTASLGLTLYRAGEPLEATLERTDRALYRAQQEGRNRAVLGEVL